MKPFEQSMRKLASRIISRHVLVPDNRSYATPESFNIHSIPVEARREDGTLLRGHCFRSRIQENVDPFKLEPGQPAVVFFPGSSGNLSAHLSYVEMLVRAGCAVLAFDYSGFGRSEGKAEVRTLHDDAQTICETARRYFGKDDNNNFSGLGLFGLSMGANLALAVAGERKDILAIALEGLYIQRELVQGILENGCMGRWNVTEIWLDDEKLSEREKIPILRIRIPRFLALPLARLMEICYPFSGKNPLRTLEKLSNVPILISHGTADPLFPFETAIRAHQHYQGPGRLWLLPGVGHAQDPALEADGEYVAQLGHFFGDCLNGQASENSACVPTVEISSVGNGDSMIRVSLDSGKEEGAYLIFAQAKNVLKIWRTWLTAGESREFGCPIPSAFTWAVKIHRAVRNGDSWECQPSDRSGRTSATADFEKSLRQLNGLIRRFKITEAVELLEILGEGDADPPMDTILRIHAARLEDLALKRHPHLSRRARKIFIRLGGIPRKGGTS